MLCDNQVFGANDNERRAGIDTDAGADVAGRHGINTIVEAHQRFGSDCAVVVVGPANLIQVEVRHRVQRFLEQPVAGSRLRGTVDPNVRDGAEPVAALAVQIVQAGEGPSIEKTRAHIADRALDFAFGPRAVRPVSFGLKAIVPAKVEEAGIGPVRSDDDLPHVVVENAFGPAAKESERVLMAANQS